MATSFPGSLDNFTNPSGTDSVANVPALRHSLQHANINDAIEAVEAKVGIDGSVVTSTLSYKLGGVTGADKAASLTGTETLSGKTLTAPKIANNGFIADPNGNEQIEFVSVASAVNNVRVTNAASTGDALIDANGGDTNINLYLKGKGTGSVKVGTAGIKLPNVDGTPNQVMKTDGSGNLGWVTPTTVDPSLIAPYTVYNQMTGTSAEFVYNQYSDSTQFAVSAQSTTILYYANSTVAGGPQVRDTLTDWASSAFISSTVTLGSFLYVLIRDASNNYRVYRYSVSNLAAGGTLMTISGQAFATTGGASVFMTSNGTNFYINYKAGNSANDRVISKYTVSGTTLTYVSDITCGASNNVTNQLLYVDASENIYGFFRSIDFTGDNKVRKYNSSGTLQYTTNAFPTGQSFRSVFTFGTASYIEYTVTGNPWFYFVRIFI